MMTPARCLRRERLHARPRRGALRHPARSDSGLHRPQGRHVGQHPGRSRDRRQDRRPVDRTVRLARGSARARRRALARPAEEPHRARRPGAPVEGARDDAARSRPRLRSCRARAPAARPFGAAGDVPPLRVPQPARPRRHPRRGRAGAADAHAAAPRSRGARESSPRCAGRASLAIRDGRFALAREDDGVIVGAWEPGVRAPARSTRS